ncbi:proteasome assembly chaperone family protein [Ilumatobacter nonamiensis]|uniref:proteasome assembly chaperone family protein n=1 Tax=Ilumatobacter nonamiensis TaxID=467093 RepID=UPI0003480DE6|nr:PAC2 family protein [Ilumatobacter nonamiensis]
MSDSAPDTPDSSSRRDELDREYGIERLVDDPTLHEPVMIVMLTGWIDAAGAAAAATDQLTRACESSPILSFDDDTYVDYRARRPTMELRDGLNTNLDWATIEMRAGRSPGGRDVLFLVGPEPDMAWRRFGRAVATLATEFGVRQMVGLGAYPFAAPHTRPARLSVSSPSSDMLAAVSFARSSVDVPAGMAGVLEHALHAQKIPSIGIWAQVPHYVSAMEYPAASVALLEGLEEVTGISIEALGLRAEVDTQRNRLDRMIAEKPENEAMLRQLEELHDLAPSESEDDEVEELELRSGDELAAEIQEFFKDQP